jgi:sugar phosphate isomerase/epimerase
MMSSHSNHEYPKLHNAMWPGLVGKGSPGAEPCIDLDTMLDLTAKAEVDAIKFDGVDIFLFEPHINIDISDDDLKKVADKIQGKGLVVGSVVAPIWPPTGGGPAIGSQEDRKKFVGQVRKGCRIAQKLRDFGARPDGVVRIDSASSVEDWAKDPKENTRRIAETFREACDVAAGYGERLAAEGEICWGGMHGWRQMVQLLELVDRPKIIGFQADMAHTLLYILGYNAPEDAILPPDWNWSDPARLDQALKTLTRALRPWTIDFHVAQNDGTVKGSGTHDKTGHHCLPTDPNGKLQIARHAGYWMRDESGKLQQAFRHICWDGCMFSNETMMKQQTWNDILSAMIAVRDAHGWSEVEAAEQTPAGEPLEVPAKPETGAVEKPQSKERRAVRPKRKPAARKPVKKAAPKAPKKAVKRPAKKAVALKTAGKAKAVGKKAPPKKAIRAKARKAPQRKANKSRRR